MAYYTALITAWNSATQPPAGVSGTGLTGLTTANKLIAINGWTVTGTIPTNFFVSGAQLLNNVNFNEFNALSTTHQANLLMLCACPGPLLGGTNNTAFLPDGIFINYFSLTGTTIANLTAFATAQAQPWWQVPAANGGGGLNGPVSQNDLNAAGGLT